MNEDPIKSAFPSLSTLFSNRQVESIVIIETLSSGQERVLEPHSHQAVIVYLETDQAIQEGL